jgi:hypothetical protein
VPPDTAAGEADSGRVVVADTYRRCGTRNGTGVFARRIRARADSGKRRAMRVVR